MLLEGPGCYWKDLGVIGRTWVLLEGPGCYWKDLGVIGRTWVLLEGPGCYWKNLGVIGRTWVLLEGHGCYWKDLGVIGRTWVLLEGPGCYWKDLGVIVMSNLSWSEHINTICRNTNLSLNLIRRNIMQSHSNTTTKKLLIIALVRSKLSFCSQPGLEAKSDQRHKSH